MVLEQERDWPERVDDLHVRPDQLDYLLKVLSGCSLVIGSAHQVIGRSGSSRRLDGLPEEAALALVAASVLVTARAISVVWQFSLRRRSPRFGQQFL